MRILNEGGGNEVKKEIFAQDVVAALIEKGNVEQPKEAAEAFFKLRNAMYPALPDEQIEDGACALVVAFTKAGHVRTVDDALSLYASIGAHMRKQMPAPKSVNIIRR